MWMLKSVLHWISEKFPRLIESRFEHYDCSRDIGTLSDSDVIALLKRVGDQEVNRSRLLYEDALVFGAMIRDRDGLRRLGAQSETLLSQYPTSCLLTYAATVARARAGRSDQARDFVAATRAAVVSKAGRCIDRGRSIKLVSKILTIIDIIDFEEKSDEDASDDVVFAGIGIEDDDIVLDQHLRARRMKQYLDLCHSRFAAASRLDDKINALRDMLRQSLRPISSYRPAYIQTADLFDTVWPELEKLAHGLEPDYTPASLWCNIGRRGCFWFSMPRRIKSLMPLVHAFEIACKLEQHHRTKYLGDALINFIESPVGNYALWPICAVLVKNDLDSWTERTRAIAIRRWRWPRLALETRAFFDWAGRVGEYEQAEAAYNRLPRRLKKAGAAQSFATILQRLGRPHEGRSLVEAIAAHRLVRPVTRCPLAHWRAMARVGELDFAAQAHELLQSVPQPRNPIGVVLTMPRTVNLSTLLPLVGLVEMKRRGWAVIPIVEGVLPLDPTGHPEIDRFLGCCSPLGRLHTGGAQQLRPTDPVDADISSKRLRWNELNLDPALWEAAAIKQRRYRVDFDCPALAAMMSRLVQWTRVTITVLENAREQLTVPGLRVATLVSFQARLPDAAVREYCEARGDPENFFCLHAANGYQNYFSNFTAAVSNRLSLANMTAEPQRRTASFPSPKSFETFYDSWQQCENASLLITRERERISRRPDRQREPAAEAVANRIAAWRADGGKVIGLFGKVVCDSAMPRHGGPAHADMIDWINHSVDTLVGEHTLLLVKPHPHEQRNEIGAYLTEKFNDLILRSHPNVIVLQHRWFGLAEVAELIDLGLVYNGTTLIELGLLDVPAIACAYWAAFDYPIGQAVPRDRAHYERMLRFAEPARTASDMPARAAAWLDNVRGANHVRTYAYHSRPVTNRAITPPIWFRDEIQRYIREGDPEVERLVDQGLALPSAKSAQILASQLHDVAS